MRELKEELAKARAQVVDAQKDRANALLEVEDLKKHLEANQILINGIDCVAKEENLLCTDEKHAALEHELQVAKKQHATVLAELQALKREMSELEEKLCVTLHEKENAMRQAEESLSSAEVNAKRVEELSNEISGTKESLLLVKMACIEANKEKEVLLAARKDNSSEQTHTQNTRQLSDDSPRNSNKLENKLKVARAEISKEELRVVRHSLVAAREALANVDKLRAGCGSPVTDATICIELEAAKAELIKALDNDALIESSLKELRDQFKEAKQELDATKTELVEVKSREARAVVVLKSELEKTKDELKAVVSCNEAFMGLSQKLQKMAVLEDESTQEEDALTVKVHTEAKAELHAMLKEEAEAVRQAELYQKTSQPLHKANQDNRMVSLNEASNSFPASHGESVANSWRRGSYKEEHKKKKLPLPSLSALLSRSKRGSRKAISPTRQDA